MPTLTQPALSMLIDRLFAEADAAENERWPATRADDREDYRQYYGLLKDQPLPVSRTTGRLLYMLARSVRARTIVEFGTSFGISTLHLAAALRDNGGGRLIGSEFEPSKITRARANLHAAGLSDLVEIREGDALQTLARDLPELDRSYPARWGEESLFAHTLVARGPLAQRCSHRRRQRG